MMGTRGLLTRCFPEENLLISREWSWYFFTFYFKYFIRCLSGLTFCRYFTDWYVKVRRPLGAAAEPCTYDTTTILRRRRGFYGGFKRRRRRKNTPVYINIMEPKRANISYRRFSFAVLMLCADIGEYDWVIRVKLRLNCLYNSSVCRLS